jgi:hypothetical protein
VYAQDTTASRPLKKYKNQIGIDMTALLQQFFNLNNNSSFSYQYIPEYFATYRRHLKNGNIRFAFSVSIYGKNDQTNDSTQLTPRKREYNYRIGYEWFSDLTNRWQIFYGLDFKNDILKDYNEMDYSSGGWGQGHDYRTITYGISAMLGIRFKFNSRVSILTETSLDFLNQDIKRKPLISPVMDNPPYPKPSEFEQHTIINTTQINYPLFIEFSFDF